jgi:hypothetical protein
MYLIKAENITSYFENLFSQQDDSQTNSLIKEGHRDHLFTWGLGGTKSSFMELNSMNSQLGWA